MRTIDARPRRSLVLGAGASALTALLAACGFHTSGELPSTTGTTSGTTSSTTSPSSGGAGGALTTSTSTTTTTGTGGAGGAITTSTTSSSTTGTGGGTTGTGGGSTGTGGMGSGGGDGGVVTYASCAEIHQAQPGLPSGVYDLLPLTGTAYKAYCDMEASGGGWTLALKIDGNASTFAYASGLWTDTNAHAPDKPELDNKEAKLASFWTIPVTALRLGMIDGGTTRWKEMTVQGSSLQALLAGSATVVTAYGNAFWKELLAAGSIQTKCNWEGLNANGRVRIGLVGDESTNCGSPDSVIGFGIASGFGPACGNEAHWFPDNGDKSTKAFGYVLVR